MVLFLSEILLLPHQTKNPRSIPDVGARHGLVDSTELLQDERTVRETAGFGAGDEGGPDETFEVRVGDGDGADLGDEVVCDARVVGWNGDVRPGWCVAFSCSGENAARVEVDGRLVGAGEGDAGREVCEVIVGLHSLGPGNGVEVADALEESRIGFQR